jgi:ATP-dependent exoDNAse (exonuclease V) beta subunit
MQAGLRQKFVNLGGRSLVENFLQSDRAQQLSKALMVHRELEFLLAWPPRDRESASTTDVRNSKASSSKQTPDPLASPPQNVNRRYLQGFIDCLYQDAQGKWHLIDYKTNRVAADRVKQAAEPYTMQLGVYALAVEQILGHAPIELAVHFLRAGAEHRFVWDDAMRRRTIEEVGDAIRTAQNR